METLFADVGFSKELVDCTLGQLQNVMSPDDIAKTASYADSFISSQLEKYDKAKQSVTNKDRYGMAASIGDFYLQAESAGFEREQTAIFEKSEIITDNFSKDLDKGKTFAEAYDTFEKDIYAGTTEIESRYHELEAIEIKTRALNETIAKECKDVFLSAG